MVYKLACKKLILSKTISYNKIILIIDNPEYIIEKNNIKLKLNDNNDNNDNKIKYLIFTSKDKGQAVYRNYKYSKGILYISNYLGVFTLEYPELDFIYDFYNMCCFNKIKCYGFNKNDEKITQINFNKIDFKNIPDELINYIKDKI